MNYIIQTMYRYPQAILNEALQTSMGMNSYNAYQLLEVAETLRRKEGVDLLPEKGESLPAAMGACPDMVPEQSNIDTYNKLFN